MTALVVMRHVACTWMLALDILRTGTTWQSNCLVPDPAAIRVSVKGTPVMTRGLLLWNMAGLAVAHLVAKLVVVPLSVTTAVAVKDPDCWAVEGSKLTTLPTTSIVTMFLVFEAGNPLSQNPCVFGWSGLQRIMLPLTSWPAMGMTKWFVRICFLGCHWVLVLVAAVVRCRFGCEGRSISVVVPEKVRLPTLPLGSTTHRMIPVAGRSGNSYVVTEEEDASLGPCSVMRAAHLVLMLNGILTDWLSLLG